MSILSFNIMSINNFDVVLVIVVSILSRSLVMGFLESVSAGVLLLSVGLLVFIIILLGKLLQLLFNLIAIWEHAFVVLVKLNQSLLLHSCELVGELLLSNINLLSSLLSLGEFSLASGGLIRGHIKPFDSLAVFPSALLH